MSFLQNLFSYIKRPKLFLAEQIEKQDRHFLTFSFYFIILIASCQYIGFINFLGLASFLSLFSYLFFLALTCAYVFLTIFMESAITSFFLQNRNVTPFPFGSKQVFMIVSLSYLPQILLPAISIFALVFGSSFYLLFSVSASIIVLVIRKKVLDKFKDHFNLATWILAVLPSFFNLALLFILMITFFSSFAVIVSKLFLGGFGAGSQGRFLTSAITEFYLSFF